MLDWLKDNTELLSLLISAAMAVIWLVYLQVILMGFIRQRRPVILITRSAALDGQARCFVTNMGSEAIYVLNLVAELHTEKRKYAAVVTDRVEQKFEDLNRPSERTNQGPLDSGSFFDAGSFHELEMRARNAISHPLNDDDITCLTITVAAATGHASHLAAAWRSFRIEHVDGERRFIPETVLTKQIQRNWRRNKLGRLLAESLNDSESESEGAVEVSSKERTSKGQASDQGRSR